MSRQTDADPPWWQAAFGAHYETLYAHRDDAAAACEVSALLPRLRRAPGPVLDACCGNGRHLAALRAAGVPAFGFDLSADLLRSARQRPEGAGRLLRCDMRQPAVGGGWGAVLMLFTAFGYFDEAGNEDCLRALGALLAPGGCLLLDQPDPAAVARTLVPRSERATSCGLVVEERALRAGRVEKTVALTQDGVLRQSYRESVRLYDRAELVALAARAGLRVLETWPGLHGPAKDDGRQVSWLASS